MKILILDDEPAISGFVEINLKRADCETVTASTGEEALSIVENDPDIDIALLDVMLPGIDGFEVCRRIRAMGRNIGIIMLSAKAQEMDKVTGLMIGADDYVPKPFSITELIARIDSLSRRLSGRECVLKKKDTEIVCGEFRLNKESRQFFRGKKEITLTQLEFLVMQYFMSNRNKAISRDELLDAVWGSSYFGDAKIVDVNVRRLRIKVEDDPADPKHLVAVWGFGYKWVG
ncbi:MAG: response regulator transcription factor [Clostridiales bacterium]|nr:response regulator transcription factor [Clostridiales bacterium]